MREQAFGIEQDISVDSLVEEATDTIAITVISDPHEAIFTPTLAPAILQDEIFLIIAFAVADDCNPKVCISLTRRTTGIIVDSAFILSKIRITSVHGSANWTPGHCTLGLICISW